MNTHREELIFKQLANLGVHPSDTVLISIDISKFGLIKGYKRNDYVRIFKDYFTEEGGTFVTLAFTPLKFSIFNNDLPFFDGTQPAYTGAFANEMLKDKDAYRSKHPTNSVVAIGRNAKIFVNNLDGYGGAYDFARRAVEMNAKILLIGMNEYPGFLTHLVEQDLKFYRKYWYRFFLKVRTKEGVYKRLDPGGCSNTFGRLYPEYIKCEVLRIGRINNAYSLCIDAKDAYQIDYRIVSENPSILICDNANCTTCRIYRWKTIWRLPYFVLKKIFNELFKFYRSLKGAP